MGLAGDVFDVGVGRHLQLQRADKDVTAQGPEVGLVDAVHTFQTRYLSRPQTMGTEKSQISHHFLPDPIFTELPQA